jgi:hypothetical protein
MATQSPLEQTLVDRMKIRVAGAPSMLMTAAVGGALGAAVGLATEGKILRYGALGAALGFAGGFAYGVYNARSAADKALLEHQAMLAAATARPHPVKPPAQHPSLAAHATGASDRVGWWAEPGFSYPWE